MKVMQPLNDGIKLTLLYGAIALVVWSLPDYDEPRGDAAARDDAARSSVIRLGRSEPPVVTGPETGLDGAGPGHRRDTAQLRRWPPRDD